MNASPWYSQPPRRLDPGRLLTAAFAFLIALATAGCAVEPAEKVPLKQLYTPRYPPPPPHEPTLDSIAKAPERMRLLRQADRRSPFLVSQTAVLLVSLVVMLIVAFDFRNLRNSRNIDLLLMQAIGWCFYEILGFLDRLHDPTSRNFMDWVFTAIVVLSVALLARAIRRVYRPARAAWRPALNRGALMVLAIALLAGDIGMALYNPPDDAGYFINIGAQRFRERGRLPYGDPLLTATPAAAYGPLLYLAHVPFQVALAPQPVNTESPDRPAIETADVYFLPPILATKLCVIAFHVLGIAALFAAAQRLAGANTAWALVALYCGSAFVLGVGGDGYAIGGVTFASHIAPASITLLAFVLLNRPAWSGVLLAGGIGVLFYPVFMVPAWLGYYWTTPDQLKRFLVGFSVAAVVIAGSVLALSRPANGRGLVGTVVYDTIGHQESPEAYGSSPFGFWGQRGGWRRWAMTPMVSSQSMTRPVVLVFFAFAASMFLVARGRTPAQLALILAAVAIGAELWKIHATATYVTWYYGFLLLGLFCDGARARFTTPDLDSSRF
jgi:hypothetical protein